MAASRFEEGFSCSQAVLSAFSDLFDLELNLALKISQPFGGGIAHRGDICGAVSGAFMSIGLKQAHVLNLVILPQALRVIIPPLTSQMLNLTKNSSLAVAIGFPDFVSVANTTINQTGQSIEGVALIMVVYLIFSLSTSAFMNWYNKRVALVER